MIAKYFGAPALAVALIAAMANAQQPASNPVTQLIKVQVAQYGNNIVGGAQDMPADKYGFQASPDVRTFGQLMVHVAQFNVTMCSRLSDQPAPDVKGLKDTDGKEKILEAMKGSFDYCSAAINALDDSTLGQSFKMTLRSAGSVGDSLTRAQGLIILAEDWFDHYSMEALYLRMNGVLPRSAQKKP